MIDRKVFMDVDQYQKLTHETAIYGASINESLSTMSVEQVRSLLKVNYLSNGLTGESGEVASLVKKLMRDSGGRTQDWEFVDKLAKELGDCLWYISELCNELGMSLEEIMELNIQKLQDRKDRGKLQGSGDNR